MPDRCGTQGPPEDAYSRVSRDLAEVTAGFADFLDRLPENLVAEYDCAVRETTREERDRMESIWAPLDHCYVLAPDGGECSTLLVGRGSYEGGVVAVLAAGHAIGASIPHCFCDACDACDEDCESLIWQANDLVQVAAGGFHEFRRPYAAPADASPHDGPWMEVGHQSAAGLSSTCGPHVRGDGFSVNWQEWPRRPST